MSARPAAAGALLAVVSATTFGSSGSFAAGLLATGWSPGAAVTVRIITAAVLLTPFAAPKLRGLRRRDLAPVVLYGVLGVGVAQLCYFYAVAHVSVSVALLIEYSGTLLVVAWMWARHGERPRRRTVAGAAVSVIGLALVVDVLGDQHVSLVGVLWAAGAAVGLAGYFVLSAGASGGGRAELPPLVLAWGGMVTAAVCLAIAGAAGALPLHANTADVTLAGARVSWLVPVIGVSLVAGAIAYTTGIAAARRLGARLASFVGLLEVLAAALFAWLLLGQQPSLVQALGGVAVLVGIALVRSDEQRPEPSAPELPVDPPRAQAADASPLEPVVRSGPNGAS